MSEIAIYRQSHGVFRFDSMVTEGHFNGDLGRNWFV